MNYKIILLIFTTFILANCNQDNQNKNSIKFSPVQKYKNKPSRANFDFVWIFVNKKLKQGN